MVNDLLSTEGMLKLFDNNKLNQMKKNNFKVNPINLNENEYLTLFPDDNG